MIGYTFGYTTLPGGNEKAPGIVEIPGADW